MRVIDFLMFLLMLPTFKIDFSKEQLKNWSIVNDGVMGGLSKGHVKETPTGFNFYGTVSLQNNGGFTAYRSAKQNYNLAEYSEVEISYKSTGVAQALQFSVDERFYIPNYKVHLPNSEEWTTKRFQLSEVQQYQLGNATGAYLTKEALNEIIRLSFITDEKKAGEFSLSVDYILFQ